MMNRVEIRFTSFIENVARSKKSERRKQICIQARKNSATFYDYFEYMIINVHTFASNSLQNKVLHAVLNLNTNDTNTESNPP